VSLRIWFLSFVVVFVSMGCSKTGTKASGVSGDPVSYAEINNRILKPFCLGCHAVTEFPHFNSYAEVKASLSAIQRAVFITRTMPKRGDLPEDELELLQRWIDQGAQELPETEVVPESSERHPVGFAELQKSLFQPRCVVCHFPNNPAKISNLEDYDEVKTLVGSLLFLAVASDKMPPAPQGTPEGAANPAALSKSEKELLSFWVIDGMTK